MTNLCITKNYQIEWILNKPCYEYIIFNCDNKTKSKIELTTVMAKLFIQANNIKALSPIQCDQLSLWDYQDVKSTDFTY